MCPSVMTSYTGRYSDDRSETLTGACWAGAVNGPPRINAGSNSRALWERQQYSGMPWDLEAPETGDIDMAARLAEQVGKGRLYRIDSVPAIGLPFAVANPPFIPSRTEEPADLSMADYPLPNPKADELYREALFVRPAFKEVPIINKQQLYGNANYGMVMS